MTGRASWTSSPLRFSHAAKLLQPNFPGFETCPPPFACSSCFPFKGVFLSFMTVRSSFFHPLHLYTESSYLNFGNSGIKKMPRRTGAVLPYFSSRLLPYISIGCGSPIRSSIVGARSARIPPVLSLSSWCLCETRMQGTGLVLCAVKGPPVSGSTIISALP